MTWEVWWRSSTFTWALPDTGPKTSASCLPDMSPPVWPHCCGRSPHTQLWTQAAAGHLHLPRADLGSSHGAGEIQATEPFASDHGNAEVELSVQLKLMEKWKPEDGMITDYQNTLNNYKQTMFQCLPVHRDLMNQFL